MTSCTDFQNLYATAMTAYTTQQCARANNQYYGSCGTSCTPPCRAVPCAAAPCVHFGVGCACFSAGQSVYAGCVSAVRSTECGALCKLQHFRLRLLVQRQHRPVLLPIRYVSGYPSAFLSVDLQLTLFLSPTHPPTDRGACASEPCKNGGQCANYISYYSCICPRGFDGYNCTNRM
jgi:hypothetical protein